MGVFKIFFGLRIDSFFKMLFKFKLLMIKGLVKSWLKYVLKKMNIEFWKEIVYNLLFEMGLGSDV